MSGPTKVLDLFAALRAGERGALARAITLVESTLGTDAEAASELVQLALAHSGRSMRLGITGIPGVGKSTFINAFGLHALKQGKRVAVLATDPSSVRSGGSILGDKTRMEALSQAEHAFIRPTPSGGHLGGVAKRTRETMVLCEAAGYEMILVETVGVGQSELEVDHMTDLNLLLMIPGAGDDLQGIKRGIMESADLILLTKVDVADPDKLRAARSALLNAIPFMPRRESGRSTAVLDTDALTGKGIEAAFDQVVELHQQDSTSGLASRKRQEQNVHWMKQAFREGLMQQVLQNEQLAQAMQENENAVRAGELDPFRAAKQLLERLRKGDGSLL